VIKSRIIGWARHVALVGERGDACRLFVGKPEGKRPLVRLRHRRKDNIKMGLQEVGCGRGMDGLIWLRIGACGGLS
jgi:hypothetical protein